MKIKAALVSTVMLAATMISLSATASPQSSLQSSQTLSCDGESLSITVALSDKSELQSLEVTQSSDAIVRQNIETAAKGKISGPVASIDNSLPIVYQGTFPSPSPQGLGAVTISTSKDHSKAELDYDNDDGDMRTFSLNCTAR